MAGHSGQPDQRQGSEPASCPRLLASALGLKGPTEARKRPPAALGWAPTALAELIFQQKTTAHQRAAGRWRAATGRALRPGGTIWIWSLGCTMPLTSPHPVALWPPPAWSATLGLGHVCLATSGPLDPQAPSTQHDGVPTTSATWVQAPPSSHQQPMLQAQGLNHLQGTRGRHQGGAPEVSHSSRKCHPSPALTAPSLTAWGHHRPRLSSWPPILTVPPGKTDMPRV